MINLKNLEITFDNDIQENFLLYQAEEELCCVEDELENIDEELRDNGVFVW